MKVTLKKVLLYVYGKEEQFKNSYEAMDFVMTYIAIHESGQWSTREFDDYIMITLN